MSGHGGWDFDAFFLELVVVGNTFFYFFGSNFVKQRYGYYHIKREDLLT